LRTFDDKINKESIDSNVDDSQKNTIKKDAANDQISTASLSIDITLNEVRSNPPNNLKEDNFVGAVNDDLKNAEANAKVSNISTKQSADASLASTSEKMSKSAEKQPLQNKLFLQAETEKSSDDITSQILQEPELELLSSMNDCGAIDPLEFSDEFNCSDEFVNTNLLDNAEFLKNFTFFQYTILLLITQNYKFFSTIKV